MSTAAQSDGKLTGDAGASASATTTTAPGVTVDWQAKAQAAEAALTASKNETSKAVQDATAKAVKEAEDRFRSSLATPEGLSKALAAFAPAAVDPVKELASTQAARAAAQAEADKWKNTALNTSRVNKVQSVLLGLPEFDPEAVAEASSHRFFSEVEIGEDLNVKDAEALKAKAAAFMAGPGKWFKKTAAPAGDAAKPAAVGAYSDPSRGPPLPTGKAPPAPGTNGQPPRIEINEANFLDAMGLGPNAIPHNQFKASNKAS